MKLRTLWAGVAWAWARSSIIDTFGLIAFGTWMRFGYGDVPDGWLIAGAGVCTASVWLARLADCLKRERAGGVA